jgi:hypothetical protein
MKKILQICLVFTIISCISTKINTKNSDDYSSLKVNSEYIVKTKTGNIFRKFIFKEEMENYITGIYQNEEMQIEKSDIIKINKFSAGKTVTLVISGAALVSLGAVVTVLILNLQGVGRMINIF